MPYGLWFSFMIIFFFIFYLAFSHEAKQKQKVQNAFMID